jgi:hypothetical protein
MRKRFPKVALVAVLLAAPLAAVADSAFPERHELDGERLDLIGTATHRLVGLVKVCRAALYGPPNAPGDDIHLSDVPKRLEIEYFVSVGRERLIAMAEESLEGQFTDEQLRPLAEQILRFNDLYRDVGKSDRYALTYHPDSGLTLELNGETLGSVAGADFARTYLSIWLGDDPVSPAMKRKLINNS